MPASRMPPNPGGRVDRQVELPQGHPAGGRDGANGEPRARPAAPSRPRCPSSAASSSTLSSRSSTRSASPSRTTRSDSSQRCGIWSAVSWACTVVRSAGVQSVSSKTTSSAARAPADGVAAGRYSSSDSSHSGQRSPRPGTLPPFRATPRSWAGSPPRTRGRGGSEDRVLGPAAEHRRQRVDDLADGGVGPHRVEDRRHQVGGRLLGVTAVRGQCGVDRGFSIAARTSRDKPLELALLDLGADRQDVGAGRRRTR